MVHGAAVINLNRGQGNVGSGRNVYKHRLNIFMAGCEKLPASLAMSAYDFFLILFIYSLVLPSQ
jgi:hypothetical protein